MQVQRIPLWFNQAATRSIGAVNNHEGARVHVRFLLAMQSNPGAANISATHLDPSKQSADCYINVELVPFDPCSTERAGARSRANALFGDHLQKPGLTSTVPARHGHRLIHQFLTGMKQNQQKIVVCAKKKKAKNLNCNAY